MRVLATYGLDDVPKLDPERIFVKSIFLLQKIHPDEYDVPEDTIIHDLEIADVRPLCPSQPPPHFPSSPDPPLASDAQSLL